MQFLFFCRLIIWYLFVYLSKAETLHIKHAITFFYDRLNSFNSTLWQPITVHWLFSRNFGCPYCVFYGNHFSTLFETSSCNNSRTHFCPFFCNSFFCCYCCRCINWILLGWQCCMLAWHWTLTYAKKAIWIVNDEIGFTCYNHNKAEGAEEIYISNKKL